ncbi:MAG TPA: hypothetical protein VIM46_05940 [Luteolibacter sp.]
MKFNTAVAKSLLMAASIGMVVPLLAETSVKPAKPAKPAKAPAEEPAKIDGIEIPRKDGGFIGVTVEGPRLVLRFYDADKKLVNVDVARAAARWNPSTKIGDVRSVMNPSDDGLSLVSTPVVKPPLNYIVYLTLLDAEGKAVESIVADLHKLNASKGDAPKTE